MTIRKHIDTSTALSNMPSKLLIAFLSLFLICLPVMSQKQVTIDRTRLAQDRSRKEAAKKQTATRKNETIKTKPRKHVSARYQKKKEERPQVATYLRVNNIYSDNVTEAVGHSLRHVIFDIYTDGKTWDVSSLPSWCTIFSRTPSSFTLRIYENPSYDPRQEWLTVRSDSKMVRICIAQEGKPINASGSIYNVRLMHNKMLNGKKCMALSGQFKVDNGEGLSFCAVAFISGKSGKYINGSPSYPAYRMDNGIFIATSNTSNGSGVRDFRIFIPNDSFDPGNEKKHDLVVNVAVYCFKNGKYVSETVHSVPFVAKIKRQGIVTKAK